MLEDLVETFTLSTFINLSRILAMLTLPEANSSPLRKIVGTLCTFLALIMSGCKPPSMVVLVILGFKIANWFKA